MADQWIVRVQDREYGPVGLDELLEWKREGRLIRENEIRESGTERWFPAGELPEVFADEAPPLTSPTPARQEESSLWRLIVETCRVYGRGFGRFLGLSALIFVPSICAQITGASMAPSGTGEIDLRSALGGLFNLFMFLTSLAAWPIYVAGIQILTRELTRGEKITLGELVSQASKFWGRIVVLCLLVYGAFFLLIMFGLAILILVAINPPSLIILCVALLLLLMQIWMFGRFFIATLFWQQTAVLEDAGITNSVSRSNELARSRRERPWWRRPAWQGAVLVSLWFVIALAFVSKSEWVLLAEYFRALTTTHDPEAILQSMSAAAKPAGLAVAPLLLGVVQAILRPVLGIAFALLYLDLKR